MMSSRNWIGAVVVFLGLVLGAAVVQAAGQGNSIQRMTASSVSGSILLKLETAEPLSHVPTGFGTSNPPRLVFDFEAMTNGVGRNSQVFNLGDLKGVNLVQVGDRTRLVLNLVNGQDYDVRLVDGALLITLTPLLDRSYATAQAGGGQFKRETVFDSRHGIKDLSFRRGKEGEGRVVVDLTDPGVGVDVQTQGKNLVVEFLKTTLPASLRRKLDVTDFGTPVVSVKTEEVGQNVRMVIEPKGLWEHNAYQADNQFVVEVREIVVDDTKLVQGSKIGYQGPRISINYQNGDVRALLRLMAEELGLNAVISESVTGTITLVLKDVPADQVIDIIFQQKGLDMRKQDNVILIAPRDELATQEKLKFESRQQMEELEPLQTETFQLNYHDAEAFKKILIDKDQRILSKRGSAVIDPRSNVLFIQDIPSRMDELRKIIARVDIPVRQVMIEARIVSADESFGRSLGARLGVFGGYPNLKGSSGWERLGTTGNYDNVGSMFFPKEGKPGEISFPGANQVNFPAAKVNGVSPSNFSFLLYSSDLARYINLEISALEADQKGKVISSPRVMTSDQVEATIEQGTEIPYQKATSSGATSIEFRKAVLSLKVKPHITPDGKISMRLQVTNDRVSDNNFGGTAIAIDTKRVVTEVLVDNGGTIVIGGIYEMKNSDAKQQVPLLGDMPVLGNLFKSNTRTTEKKELLVFITPRIVNQQLNLQ